MLQLSHVLRHLFGSPGPISAGDDEIVGVVEDTAYTDVRWKNHAMCFIPLMQRSTSTKTPIEKDGMLYVGAIVLATVWPMLDMEAIAQRTLAGISPNLSLVKFQTFDARIGDRFSTERMLSRLTTLFGAPALLLAAVGLYGVTSYTVARRTSEIGIPMALGAERAGLVAMVLRSALLQALLGLVIGVPVAYYCVKFVKSQLYQMNSVSFGALAIAVGTLLTAAFVAGLLPARRAASIEPMQALRTE